MSEQQETRKPNRFRITSIIIAVAISCFMVGTSVGIMLSPGFPTVIEPGSMTETATFVIFKDASTTYAKNGTTGAMAFFSASSSSVIQYAIDAIADQSGGNIFIKSGNYTLSTMLNISKKHIAIDGEPGTIFTSSLLPCFTIYGAYDFDTYGFEVSDVQITNLDFYYTGTVLSGPFIYVHKVQGDPYTPGQFRMENIIIRSFQRGIWPGIPILTDFAGLYIDDVVGGQFTSIAITYFGTGLLFNGTNRHDMIAGGHEISSNNIYTFVNIAYCEQGVWYSNHTHSAGELWISLKVCMCGQYGFKTEAYEPRSLTLISPNFEAIFNVGSVGIQTECMAFMVMGGVFSGHMDAGIILFRGYGATPVSGTFSATIENCVFAGIDTAILTQRNTTLISNVYLYGTGILNPVIRLPEANVISIGDGYVLNSRGSATISSSTTVTFYHNMSETPELVLCSFNSTATGAWTWTATSTEITITVVTSGTYTVYWEAKSW
jgi:hypothetical protein